MAHRHRSFGTCSTFPQISISSKTGFAWQRRLPERGGLDRDIPADYEHKNPVMNGDRDSNFLFRHVDLLALNSSHLE